MSARRPLDVIEVRNPCPADWNQMTGDSRRRFCSHCNKFVHDLTEMPADEADKLVCAAAGSLCVRFARDAAGQVITLDYASKPKSSRRRALATIISLAAAIVGAGGWTALKFLQNPLPSSRIMGDMQMMPTPPTSRPQS